MERVLHICPEDWSIDTSGVRFSRYRSATLKQRLIDELKKDSYAEHMGALCRANPTLGAQLRRLAMSDARLGSALAADASDDIEFGSSHGIELILAVILRQRQYQTNHFLPACLSLIALRCRVPVLFWTLLSEYGILYSRNFTKDLALKLGKQLMPRNGTPGAVGCHVIFDNLAKYMRTNMQHVDRENELLCSNQWTFVNGPFLQETEVVMSRYGEWGGRVW